MHAIAFFHLGTRQHRDHLTLMGAVASCAVYPVPPLNEKSHCVQSQQAGKPQSKVWSDPCKRQKFTMETLLMRKKRVITAGRLMLPKQEDKIS